MEKVFGIAADKSYSLIVAFILRGNDYLKPVNFNKYLLGLVSTYLCIYHRTEKFKIELAKGG